MATCGVTNYAQEQLGDIVFVSLPEVGDVVEQGAPVSTVESVKAASDVYATISGTVTEVNSVSASQSMPWWTSAVSSVGNFLRHWMLTPVK